MCDLGSSAWAFMTANRYGGGEVMPVRKAKPHGSNQCRCPDHSSAGIFAHSQRQPPDMCVRKR